MASVQPAGATADAATRRLEEFLDILRFAQTVVLAITVLIAFNTMAISGEERAREHATMFAFGVPTWRVLAQAVTENAIIGVLATAVGIAAGLGVLRWVVGTLSREVFPELGRRDHHLHGIDRDRGARGRGRRRRRAAAWGGRLRRMDVPSTLRVVE